MRQKTLFKDIENINDIVFTPDKIAYDVVQYFKPEGRILDPCKGDGAFFRHMPGADWCESREGRDFFDYETPVDWIMGNPPFSLYFEWLLHSFEIADNIVYLLPMGKIFQSYRNLKAISKFGGIPKVLVLGTGSVMNFPVGFAIGAIYFKRDYKGSMDIVFYT